jgi:predicted glycosyltransferase
MRVAPAGPGLCRWRGPPFQRNRKTCGSMQRLRIALYSHDAMGLGHMRRNLLLANALRQFPVRADVLLIAGARELAVYPLPAGVDCITLPGFSKAWRKLYLPKRLHMDRDALSRFRARLIRTALDEYEPDMFIVDRHPRGLLNELDESLELLASRRRRPRIVLGLRDVLDEPDAVRREWAESAFEEAVRTWYDTIWVYGDRAVYNPLDEYDIAADVAARVHFSGYLDPRGRFMARPARDAVAQGGVPADVPIALCQVGGGQDGGRIAAAFAAAPMPSGVHGVIVTGPFMPFEVRNRVRRLAAARRDIHVIEFVSDPERLLERAQSVVTMGGYNSVCELLAREKRSLIVPRVSPRTEQLIRARRLQELGLAHMLHPSELTPEALGDWLHADERAPTGAGSIRQQIDFNGLERLPRLVTEAFRPIGPPVSEGAIPVKAVMHG